MIIAIPVEEGAENLCVSFGRTPYFLIYDTEKAAAVTVKNSAADAQGGAGIQAAQLVVDQGANALITVRCGQNAADVCKAAGVKIYKARGNCAAENLKALEMGTLEELTRFHPGFHGKE